MDKLLNFEGVEEGDLNKTWAMLSQLRQSNPAKYNELIDYMKKGQEEYARLDKMIPQPHSVYTVECTRLDERLTCYINVMSWERIKYPEPDQPISLLIGVELAKLTHNDLVAHVAASPKVLSEITESDHETQKEFRRLLTKFMQDNYGAYRFYSNKMRLFERANQTQYYGKLADDPKCLFISTTKKKKMKTFTVDDVIRREEMEDKEEEEIKEKKNEQPKTLVEALEREMKEAKLIEEKEEEKETKEKTEDKPKKKTLIVEVEKETKPLEKMEYVINDKHAHYMTISIRLDPNIDMNAIRTITSPTQLKVIVPGHQPLELPLPANIKDEAVHAKFAKKKAYNILTIKAPRCGGIESSSSSKEPTDEVFNETFCSNLQRAFAAQH